MAQSSSSSNRLLERVDELARQDPAKMDALIDNFIYWLAAALMSGLWLTM